VIESMTGDDDLEPRRIEQALAKSGTRMGLPLVVRRSTGSTNDDAKEAARAGVASGATFVADAQTSGRGRLGRSWHSPPGANLYASFVLRPAIPPSELGWVPLAAGLAVLEAIRPRIEAGEERLRVKWPNDVLLDGRKLAGVLSEAEITEQAPHFVVVGIGINVRVLVFPDDLAARATSLALASANDLDRGMLLVAVCEAFGSRLSALERGLVSTLSSELTRVDALAGRSVRVGDVRGHAVGVAADGRLRVRGEDGIERSCASGEVWVV
jgi:BirA family transcriptional regulator, biotin operon repressor / biotin---[acetyl-CoA-carboxylase] ligase